jgi:hypothetical protein
MNVPSHGLSSRRTRMTTKTAATVGELVLCRLESRMPLAGAPAVSLWMGRALSRPRCQRMTSAFARIAESSRQLAASAAGPIASRSSSSARINRPARGPLSTALGLQRGLPAMIRAACATRAISRLRRGDEPTPRAWDLCLYLFVPAA